MSAPNVEHDIQTGQYTYVPERRRWAVLMAFSLANMSNSMLWVTFAPIASLAESYYGVSDTGVNAFSVSYLAAYIPGSLAALAIYSFKRDGLRRGIVLAAVTSAIGAFLRYFASSPKPVYGLALTGQYLAALSQPFMTNVPPKFSQAWFPTSERDVATVLASMANPVGIAVGSILPAVFVSQNNDGVVEGMDTLLLVEAILATLGAAVAALLVKSRPSVPPSAAAAASEALASGTDDESVHHVLSRNVVRCMRNRHFLVLLAAFGIGLGMFNALTTLVEQLIAPFCYNEDDASLFAGLLLGCGLVSAGVVGMYLDKSHDYKFVLKTLFSLATATILLYSIMLRPTARAGLAVTFAILGGTMLPILPTSLEAAVECTYPVPEEYSTGLLMSAGMITGICFIVGLQRLAEAQPTCEENNRGYYFSWSSAVLLASGAVATFIAFQFRGPRLRLRAEREVVWEVERAEQANGEEPLLSESEDETQRSSTTQTR